MSDLPKKYRPSNGNEGEAFISIHCYHCINGKYEHTGDINDKPCEILSRAFMFDIKEAEYPDEWCYINGKATCTSFVRWDWDQDNDGNWNDPPAPPVDDPNQLCMPFIFDEIGIHKSQLHEQSAAQ